MTFIFDKPAFPGGSKPAGGMASLGAIWESSIEQMRMVDNVNASTVALGEAYEQRIAAIKTVTGQELRNPMTMTREEMIALGPNRRRDLAPLVKDFDDRLRQLAAQYPQFSEEIGATRPIARDAERIAREADQELGNMLASRPGWEGFVTSLGGGMMGSLEDPAQLLTLGLGAGSGSGRTLLARILGTAIREAAVNGAVEAAFQPVVQDWRRQAGLPNGLGEAASNIGFAMLGGFVLGGAGHAVGEAIGGMLPRRVDPALRDRAAARFAAAEGVSEKMRAALEGDFEAAAEVRGPIRETQPAVVRGALDEVVKEQVTVAAREEGRAAARQPIPDTRGQGVQYHGSSSEIAAFDEGHYNNSNIYGNGFYTTDAADVAASYRRKGKGDAPVMYRIVERTPVQFADMEAPISELPPNVHKALTEDDDMFALAYESLTFGQDRPEPNLREVLDELRAISAGEGWSRDDVHEAFESLRYNLAEAGYGGMTHAGGLRTNTPQHTVKIYFEPGRDIELVRLDPHGLPSPDGPRPVKFDHGAGLAARAAEGDATALDELAAADPVMAPRVETGPAYPTRAPDLSALDDPFDTNQLTASLSEYEGLADDLLNMPAIDENGDVVSLADLLDDAKHDDGLSRLVAACML